MNHDAICVQLCRASGLSATAADALLTQLTRRAAIVTKRQSIMTTKTDEQDQAHAAYLKWKGCCYTGDPKDQPDYRPFTDGYRAALQEQPIPLNIIRKWPEGFADRLQVVWLDTISFIPNVKLFDVQQVLAEFGFVMTITEARRIEGGDHG